MVALRPIEDKLHLPLVLAAAAVSRLVVFLIARPSPQRFWSLDDRDYLPAATHLHAAYLTSSGRLFDLGLRRTPGYPLFIRGIYDVFGRSYAPIIAVQLVLSIATVAITYWLAAEFLPRRYAAVAAGLLAVDPASIVFANQLLTEALFTFLFVLSMAVLLMARRRNVPLAACLSGVLLGGAVLVRPVAEYLPVALLLVLLLLAGTRVRARAILAAAVAVGFLVPVGGWAIRNYHVTGVPVVSTIDGHNMLQYNAVGALVESGEPRQLAQHDVLVRLAPHVHPGENAARVSRAELKVGLAIVSEHPLGAFKDWVRGEVKLLIGPSRAETATLLTGRTSTHATWLRGLIILEALITLAIIVGAAAGFFGLLIGRVKIRELWILAAGAAYLIVVSGGHVAYSRFRVPVDPILAIFGASALMWFEQQRATAE